MRQAIEKTVIWFVLVGGAVYWNTGLMWASVLVATFICLLGCLMSAFIDRYPNATLIGVGLSWWVLKAVYEYMRPLVE